MPDPSKKTVSASQAAALFNSSPYLTRWMLYKHFHDGLDIEPDEHSRMTWGRKMQPLVIEQSSRDLRLEVAPNPTDQYVTRGLLGCTRDATIICPDRGPGALETKCVFDYRVWMTDWGGGSFVPRHYEIQLQTQMFVGEGERSLRRPRLGSDGTIPTDPYQWGVIAAWVCGDMYYFERKPLPGLWMSLEREARQFFKDVCDGREPDPFGVPIETPWLTELFPCEPGKELDLSADAHLGEVAIQYAYAKEQQAAGVKVSELLKAKLLAAAKDAETMILRDGVKVTIRPHGKGKRIKVYSGPEMADDLLMGG